MPAAKSIEEHLSLQIATCPDISEFFSAALLLIRRFWVLFSKTKKGI